MELTMEEEDFSCQLELSEESFKNVPLEPYRTYDKRAFLRSLENKLPDWIFSRWANWYYRNFKSYKVKISRVSDGWMTCVENVRLVCSTPKLNFERLRLSGFSQKFERFFKIEEGDTVLDVGACVGDTTVPMAMLTGELGTVIAVEPFPPNVKYLKLNLAEFPNVHIFDAAAGGRAGKMPLYISPSYMGHSLKDKTSEVIDVRVDTLDGMTRDFDRIDFAKIDVQGCEVEVLEGAYRTLAKTRKLVVETHYEGENVLFPKVAKMLHDAGFSVRITPDKVVHGWRPAWRSVKIDDSIYEREPSTQTEERKSDSLS
jgi:FkbM family methyltransferase